MRSKVGKNINLKYQNYAKKKIVRINGHETEIEVFKISQDVINKVRIDMYGSIEAGIEAERQLDKMMCKCSDENIHENVTYHADNTHPEIDKHHWRHDTCGKIVQIG